MHRYILDEAQRAIFEGIMTEMNKAKRGLQFIRLTVSGVSFEQAVTLIVPFYLTGCIHVKVYTDENGNYTLQGVFNNTNNHRRRMGLPMIRRKRG